MVEQNDGIGYAADVIYSTKKTVIKERIFCSEPIIILIKAIGKSRNF